MLEKSFIKNLRPQEKVIKLMRQYPVVYTLHFFISFLLITLAFFLLYPLIKLDSYGLLLFFVLLFSGIIYGFKTFLIWSLNAFLITNERIIDFNQKGLLHKQVSEATFDNIEDVSYNKKGFWATLFNYGEIKIQTAGQKANLVMQGIKEPDKIQNLITHLQKKKK